MIENDIRDVIHPVVTGSNGDLKIAYRSGERKPAAEGENVLVPVEARPVIVRQTLTGYDIYSKGDHVAFVTEKDFSKVTTGLDYYVRRCLAEQSLSHANA